MRIASDTHILYNFIITDNPFPDLATLRLNKR